MCRWLVLAGARRALLLAAAADGGGGAAPAGAALPHAGMLRQSQRGWGGMGWHGLQAVGLRMAAVAVVAGAAPCLALAVCILLACCHAVHTRPTPPHPTPNTRTHTQLRRDETHKPPQPGLQGESSTGVRQSLDGVGELCAAHGALLLVDSVAALGGVPFLADAWGVDAAYTGSQKCLSAPPGAAPLMLGPRAVAKLRGRKTKVRVGVGWVGLGWVGQGSHAPCLLQQALGWSGALAKRVAGKRKGAEWRGQQGRARMLLLCSGRMQSGASSARRWMFCPAHAFSPSQARTPPSCPAGGVVQLGSEPGWQLLG